MNILYVFFSDYDPSMAHGGQIIHTANALQTLGHDVTVSAAGDARGFARENEVEISFEVKQSPLSVGNTHVDHLAYYLFTTSLFRAADVVFTRDIWFLKFLEYVPDRFVPQVIYEAHQCYAGIDYIDPEEEYDRLQRADVVVTQSHGVADDLRSLGVEVAAVIPNAANTDLLPDASSSELRSQLDIEADSLVLVYAGSLNEWKNHIELLVDGVGELDVACMLLIVGGDDERLRELEMRADEHQPAAVDTRTTGRVPHRKVFRYLKAADIGVVPLRRGHEEAERYTSPIKLFEYLASGLQVVASDVPAISETFGESDVVHRYEPGSVDSFVAAVERAARSEATPEQVYSYERRAELIDDQIERLVANRAAE